MTHRELIWIGTVWTRGDARQRAFRDRMAAEKWFSECRKRTDFVQCRAEAIWLYRED